MTDKYPDGYIASQIVRAPAGRPGEPEELCAALIFLASDASS
jgi:NAD(P)-dependent dehydrogenase (short-subunit alcohol dehydrogenase family)